MTARLEQWTLDVRDVAATARFRAVVPGYRIGDDGQHLWPPPDAGPHAQSVRLQPVDVGQSGDEFCVLRERRADGRRRS